MIRLFILSALLWIAGGASFAAEGEAELFRQAEQAFRDRFFERAEQQFAEFVTAYPGSTNTASAILFQAQARHAQRKFDAAVELLRAHADKAGALADEFLFRQAEALSEKGDHAGAADLYGRVLQEFPQSNLRLSASYLQAFSVSQAKDTARAIDLLRNPEGEFQKLAKANSADIHALRGQLLLSELLLGSGAAEEARAVAAAAVTPTNAPALQAFDWERHQLLARIDFSGQKPETALAHITNALASARAAQKPALLAQSWNLEAEIFKKLNQPDAAVAAYEKIASAEGLSIVQRRLAMLKSVEILSTSAKLANAISRLEGYLTANTNEPAADFLRVKAGELWLDQFRALAPASGPAPAVATNALQQAREHLDFVLVRMTNSTHIGRAWLNLGWVYWEEGTRFKVENRVRESETAFQNAHGKLTRSDDQALALFKIADAQLYLGRPESALTNFVAVLNNYADLPQVRNSLFDRTLRQLIRTSVELKNYEKARQFTAEMREKHPNNPLTEEAVYFLGSALAGAGKTEEARAVFADFIKSYPGSALLPEVRLAEAKTHRLDGDWATAIARHEEWLGAYSNHTLRAEVEFQRAALYDQAGNRTNALGLFSNFVARYPTNPLAPAAQMWVADYYFDLEQYLLAEQNYQRVFQNTNWTRNPLHFEARMMAASTAFHRQGYADARAYLNSLVNDPRCPPDLQPQAYFALGDVWIAEPITGTTNALNNFVQGAAVFDLITRQYPNHKLAPLAWAKKGECHANLASQYEQSIAEATNAYKTVLSWKGSEVPVRALNEAEIGLGIMLERIAAGKPAAEQEKLRKAALDHYLNVVYGTTLGERRSDPFFVKVAGREAGRLAEALGQSGAAMELYKRLITEAPALKTVWERRIAALEERLAVAAELAFELK